VGAIAQGRTVAEQQAPTQMREAFQIVSFRLGNEEYGIEISSVKEINRFIPITKVPQSAAFIEGVIDLRGSLVTIVDLRARFSMAARERDRDSRIMIVDVDAHHVGFIVDSVCEVLRINTQDLEEAPELVGGLDAQFIDKIAKHDDRLIVLLKLSHIISLAEPSTPQARVAA
jgi:purine-binding chemotaxis protein CheW